VTWMGGTWRCATPISLAKSIFAALPRAGILTLRFGETCVKWAGQDSNLEPRPYQTSLRTAEKPRSPRGLWHCIPQNDYCTSVQTIARNRGNFAMRLTQ